MTLLELLDKYRDNPKVTPTQLAKEMKEVLGEGFTMSFLKKKARRSIKWWKKQKKIDILKGKV